MKTSITRSLVTACFLLSLTAGAAFAGAARTHDGFFLRVSTGMGAGNAEISDASGSLKFSGTSIDGNFAVGAMVTPTVALHGTVWGWRVNDPDAELTVTGVGSTTATATGTLMMAAYGVGGTYYLMPANMYFSGSLGLCSLSGTEDMDGSSKTGFAFDATVGKEWWVSNDLGLGLSGNVSYFSAKDDTFLGTTESFSGPSFGMKVSATFN